MGRERPALALGGDEVLIGFGGNAGGCGKYHGYVVAVPTDGTGPIGAYEVPTTRVGAVWAPAGIAVASDGNIYLLTGNASST